MRDILRLVSEAQAFMRTLNIDQWQDGYPQAEVLREDIALGQLYVCDDERGVGAMAALSLLPEPIYDDIEGEWRTPGPYLTVHRMALDDAHRGAGWADRLLEKAVQLAAEHGCVSVRADTHRGNLAMRRFLEKRGFQYCGWVRYEVEAGDPMRVAYERPL